MRRPGLVARRPSSLPSSDLTLRHRIPVTRAARTLIDIAPRLSRGQLERVVNRADALNLVDPEALRAKVKASGPSRGAALLRALFDRDTFRLTESELERRFLGLVRRAGLPLPETQASPDRHRTDFYWPVFRLVVETDGLTYHRTAITQARDARRDREHAENGLQTLRFTHFEVLHEPGAVAASLAKVIAQSAGDRAPALHEP